MLQQIIDLARTFNSPLRGEYGRYRKGCGRFLFNSPDSVFLPLGTQSYLSLARYGFYLM